MVVVSIATWYICTSFSIERAIHARAIVLVTISPVLGTPGNSELTFEPSLLPHRITNRLHYQVTKSGSRTTEDEDRERLKDAVKAYEEVEALLSITQAARL